MFRSRIAIIAVLALGFVPVSVHAFAVSPPAVDMAAARGQSVDRTIAVSNPEDAERTFYLDAVAFVPDETSGVPRFLAEEPREGMVRWIRFPSESVRIPARSKAEVPFTVNVPTDVASGSYYAAITVSGAPSDVVTSNGASIDARVAVMVFLTVEGENDERGAVLDFVTPDGGLTSSHRLSYAYRIQNQGNVTLVPSAVLVGRDVFGREIYRTDANATGSRVLPGTTRTFDGQLMESGDGFLVNVREQWQTFAIGPIAVSLEVEGVSTAGIATIGYWYVPWQLLACVGAGVLIACLLWRQAMRQKTRTSSRT